MEVIEVDVDRFLERYALAMRGLVPPPEEDELCELACDLMDHEDLDPETRHFFRSAFLMISKKNKRFLDLRKMHRHLQGRKAQS